MDSLDIVIYPADVLSQTAREVGHLDDDIRKLIEDMTATMYAAPGIGLAAPQVNRSLRICLVDISNPHRDEPRQLHVLVNPKITQRAGTIYWEEGCLSMPKLFRDVKRSARVTVEAVDALGQERRIEAEGLFAVCLQHELDHLDGVMFTDRLSPLKRKMALKEWTRLREKFLREREREAERLREAGGLSSSAQALLANAATTHTPSR
jgi:peptide deformylase